MKCILYLIVVGLSTSFTLAYADDFKIGAVLGLSGPAHVWGNNAREAIELGIDQINSKGGVNGHRFSVVFEDSQTVPKNGLSAYRKLIDRDKVEVVIGDVWAFLTVPLIPLSERDKVIVISPTVMNDSSQPKSPYFFSFGHRFASIANSVGVFFKLNPGIKRLGIVAFDDYWNWGFTEQIRETAQKFGITVVTDIKGTDRTSDFRSEVTKLKHIGVDAIFVSWQPEVMKQRMHEQNLSVPLLCSSDTVEAIRYRQPGSNTLDGTYFVDWIAPTKFRDSFVARFGHEPTFEAHNSYEIIMALARALDQDGPDLKAKLSKLKYQGVEGPIDFSQAPYVNFGQAQLFMVKGTTFVPVVATN